MGSDQPAATTGEDGGHPVKHSRYNRLLLAESHLTRRLFGVKAPRIAALPGSHSGENSGRNRRHWAYTAEVGM